MVDSDTLRKSNFYTDVVTEAYSNGEGEAVSVSTIDKRVVSASGWISCKCNIDESMGVKIISPEGVRRARNMEELEDSTMAYYIDFRNAEILFTKDLIGKTIYYEYYGTGVDRMCVNRIYTDLDNYGNILMTLEDMTNKYVQILNYLEGIENLDTKLNELKISIKSSDISIDELAESILIASQSKDKLGDIITIANNTKEELSSINQTSSSLNSSLSNKNSIATSNINSLTDLNNNASVKINKLDGESGLIKKSSDKINELDSKITLSDTHENNLKTLINSSINHENVIGNDTNGLIKQASDKESSLQSKIDLSTSKEESLNTVIDTSTEKYSNLNTLNETVVNTTLPSLNSKNNEAKSTLTNLQQAILDGNVISKDAYELGEDGRLKDISNTDVLTITKSGKYRGSGCTNAPILGGTLFFYDVDVWSNNYIRIVAKKVTGQDTYTNIYNTGSWSGWKHEGLSSYRIGDIKVSTINENPSVKLLGSTWEEVEGGIDGLYFWKRLT